MERLTIPDERIDEHTTRRKFIDVEAVREHAMEFYWRLKAYEDTGLTPEEITAMRHTLEEYHRTADPLLSAKAQGRVVVLPCKVGDTVYILRRTFDGADVVGKTELWWTDIPQLGKTVFLTREEAEKALEAKKNE